MNIGVVLNYFPYFLHFPKYDADSSYSFITSRNKYTSHHIPSLRTVHWQDYKTVSRKAIGDVETIFKPSVKLGILPSEIDLPRLCAFYEYAVEQFIEDGKIDLFISGGVSGFERAALATARRLGIRTLCLWEGMFRPFTISADPIGMNAEASIAGTPFSQILKHPCSLEFEILWNKLEDQRSSNYDDKRELKTILGNRFRIKNQLRNRIADRSDIERLRLPWRQLAASRISYYAFRNKYRTLESITEPFIFFPLQMHTDSNILLNSELGSVDAFLQLILSAFKMFHEHTGVQLIIKEHPIDLFRKSYQRKNGHGVYWVDPATPVSHILRRANCLATVVINSTSGVESLLMEKPVLCLGKALYAYPELVEIPESVEVPSVQVSLEKLLERKVELPMMKRFCGFLYDHAQLDGDIDSLPDGDEVRRCCASIKNRLQIT
jgi:capsular polysaccharide export protein